MSQTADPHTATDDPGPQLTQDAAQRILAAAGVRGPVQVTPVRTHNHVWRLRVGNPEARTFYLKTHTKHWYAGNPDAPASCVVHEAASYGVLAAHGLSSPAVITAAVSTDNPFGRPFLLTAALDGAPLTVWFGARDSGTAVSTAAALAAHALPDRNGLPHALHSVGVYARRMHTIGFRFPGYIMTPDGPPTPLDPTRSGHVIWSARNRQTQSLASLLTDRNTLPSALFDAVRERLSTIEQALGPAYDPPRFVHGDCHAHQFFVSPPAQPGEPWQVHGVVDLEVASAGDSLQDLVTFCIEAAVVFPPASRWWEPFFAGYGGEPEFDLFRLRLLSVGHPSFAWPRPPEQRRPWEHVLRHLLAARDWDALFDGGW